MNLTKVEQKNLYLAIRQFFYFVLTFAFVAVLYKLANNFGSKTFSENTVVENIQLIFLLLGTVSFLYCCLTEEKWRELSFLLASITLMAVCRELDKFFDEVLPIISWKFAYIFLFVAIFYAWLHFKKSVKSIMRFFGMPSFYMMCTAVILILPVAQSIGHRPFIVAVLGENYGRAEITAIKELFEEALEVVGYFLILLSSVEYNINVRREK